MPSPAPPKEIVIQWRRVAAEWEDLVAPGSRSVREMYDKIRNVGASLPPWLAKGASVPFLAEGASDKETWLELKDAAREGRPTKGGLADSRDRIPGEAGEPPASRREIARAIEAVVAQCGVIPENSLWLKVKRQLNGKNVPRSILRKEQQAQGARLKRGAPRKA
jgi:hypothetical protein